MGEFLLRIASSAAGQWIANLFKQWGYKRQGAQEAASRGLEHANTQARKAQAIEEDVYSAPESVVNDRLQRDIRSNRK